MEGTLLQFTVQSMLDQPLKDTLDMADVVDRRPGLDKEVIQLDGSPAPEHVMEHVIEEALEDRRAFAKAEWPSGALNVVFHSPSLMEADKVVGIQQVQTSEMVWWIRWAEGVTVFNSDWAEAPIVNTQL